MTVLALLVLVVALAFLWRRPRTGAPFKFNPARARGHEYTKRLGSPRFQDPAVQAGWLGARREALEHVLRLAAGSRWSDRLVLRGSACLRAWAGDLAREPRDLDWVLTPQTLEWGDAETTELVEGLMALLHERPSSGAVTLAPARVDVYFLYDYSEAKGHRLCIPWSSKGLPPGTIELDLVAGEPLPTPPERLVVPTLDGKGIEVWAASKSLQLAWKLLWLLRPPNSAKDLYDALLLADAPGLSREVIAKVLEDGGTLVSPARLAEVSLDLRVDWEDFEADHPGVLAAYWARVQSEQGGEPNAPGSPEKRLAELLAENLEGQWPVG